jgi:hypothetical protein
MITQQVHDERITATESSTFNLLLWFTSAERSTKSHELDMKKVSCGFVDLLTCIKDLKIWITSEHKSWRLRGKILLEV